MKPGYRTSEFWFTLVSFIFSGLFLTGIITEHDDKEELISVVAHGVESVILIAGQAGIFYKYIAGRKDYKTEYERNKNKELEDYIGVDRDYNKININYAPLGEIIQLPHIGPTIGQNIIDYRNNVKEFDSINELKRVQGIGDSILKEITPYITLWGKMSSSDIIKTEFNKLLLSSQDSLKEVKKFAIGEMWKILQLLTAAVIRLIENIGKDLSSPEKKLLAMELITEFYDKVFKSIEIPVIPSTIEPLFHNYIKKIVMILVDSAIDSMVATFRELGIFVSSKQKELFSLRYSEAQIVDNFIKNLETVRIKWTFH